MSIFNPRNDEPNALEYQSERLGVIERYDDGEAVRRASCWYLWYNTGLVWASTEDSWQKPELVYIYGESEE